NGDATVAQTDTADASTATDTTPSTSTSTGTSTSTAASTPTQWVECASESGTCSFSGTREVRYGTSSQYVTKTLTSGAACNNATFGDPAVGADKTCWYADL